MSITKTISTLSLAFAMVGGAIVLAPSNAEAAGRITNSALKKGGVNQSVKKPGNSRPGQQANKWSRPCSAAQRCRN